MIFSIIGNAQASTLGLNTVSVHAFWEALVHWVPGFFFPRVGSAWALELRLASWSRGPLVP